MAPALFRLAPHLRSGSATPPLFAAGEPPAPRPSPTGSGGRGSDRPRSLSAAAACRRARAGHPASVGSLRLNDRGEDVLAADGRDYALDDFAGTEWPERALAGVDVREQLFHRLWVDCHRQASRQTTCHQELWGLCPPAPEFGALPLRTLRSRLRQTQGGEGGTPSARRRAGPSDSPTSPLFFALKERLFF